MQQTLVKTRQKYRTIQHCTFTKVRKHEPNSIDFSALFHFHQQHQFKKTQFSPYKMISKQEQEGQQH